MANAFNGVSRQAFLNLCVNSFDELTVWACFCYGQHSKLWHQLGQLVSAASVQQGDPLGPLLFLLVLHLLVLKIAADPECQDLLLNVWYLDDGCVAGSRKSLLRVLEILHSEGALLGLQLNLRKCETFSKADLSDFSIMKVCSCLLNLELLGTPIGDF